MKFRVPALVGIVCAAAGAQSRPEPFVPVAVQYVARAGASRDAIARDLQSIRAMGFNTIETPVRWAAAEPLRGKYGFDGLDRVFDAAAPSGLRVIVTIDNAPPEWILRRYSDGRRIPENRSTVSRLPVDKQSGTSAHQVCLDHPGIREDLRSFVAAASSHASRAAAFHAIDVFGDPPDGFCLCPHTARRAQAFASKGIVARDDYLRMSVRDDLALMADAARGARSIASHGRVPSILREAIGVPAQDDWLMRKAVHSYGTSVSGALPPERFALLLDGMAGAAGPQGAWMRADASVPENDGRLAGWAAISRGARMLSYARPPERGTFEGVITRNPSLFAPLKPVQSQVAILFDPRDDSGASSRAIARAHAAFFQQNIPVDVVHVDEVADLAGAAGYRAVVVASVLALPPTAADGLKKFVAGGGTVVNAVDQSLSAERIVQLAAVAGVAPVVKIDGGRGVVETRFLESNEVLMLIGLNYGDASQKVTMTFAPDTQEAIWQNMETGAGVNFVAGASGPTYAYWFAPRDALVLMIKKNIR